MQEKIEHGRPDEPSFESQFEKREKIPTLAGMAEVVDIHPEHEKTSVPVFISPGWGGGIDAFKASMEVLMKQDRRVMSLNHPRTGGSMEKVPKDLLEKYPQEQLRKALTILGILKSKGIEKSDVIAHSEGAVAAIIAATLKPSAFRNIVLYGPAGMIGEDSALRLMKGSGAQKLHEKSMDAIPGTDTTPGLPEIPLTETAKKMDANYAQHLKSYIARNPIRSANEIRTLATAQIHDMLRELHDKGIGIVVMAGVDDPVFPMERIQKIAKSDQLDGFLSVRGGHGDIGNYPETHMKAAEFMLTALEKKAKKRG
ncbi:MAG: alpha/beta fold hydrolase [bacterium]